MRNAEYDRFGPWILKISDEDPLPPLFIPCVPANIEPVLGIKIPRSIDRRDAEPGWNLYDYVIYMYSDNLRIWIRRGESVETAEFRYGDIRCIVNREILLSGKLSFLTESGWFSFEYSTVSSEIIRELIKIIREKYNLAAERVQLPEYSCPHEPNLSFYFSNIKSRELEDNGSTRLLFCQRNETLDSLEDNILKKILHRLGASSLLESIHFCDGKELKIIGRGRAFSNIFHAVYGTETLWLPIKELETADIRNYSGKAYSSIRLRLKNHEIEYFASAENAALPVYVESLKKITDGILLVHPENS